LPIDPTLSIAEILGEKPVLGQNPEASDFHCRFMGKRCNKSVRDGVPYPICIINKRNGDPVCVCPKRFFEINFLQDVIDHAWPWQKPTHPKIASEVKMDNFGNVDFVIADTEDNVQIDNFISVELQAIDITGTVRDAYDAILSNKELEKKKSYGFNWKNVYKRYVTQLISKGYYHHHWGSKIVATNLQTAVLYKTAPSKEEFFKKISSALTR